MILQGNSCSIAQKSGGIWTVQTDLQQIYPKSDRLLSFLACYLSVDEILPCLTSRFLPLDAANICLRVDFPSAMSSLFIESVKEVSREKITSF